MKVLYVIDHLGGGGAEQQAVFLANTIKADEKILCLTESRGIRAQDIKDPVVLLGGEEGRRTPCRTILALKRLIDVEKPDIIHSFLMYSSVVTGVSLSLTRHRPLFICQESSIPRKVLASVRAAGTKKALLKFAYSKADQIVTVSESSRNSLIMDGFLNNSGKTVIIWDGLDISALKSLAPKNLLRETLGLSQDAFYFCFVGSLVYDKGVDYLISAFLGISSPRFRLLILGDGTERTCFERLAGNDDRISFLGFRKNAAEYIRASDVFVFPSLYEGLGGVVIEAMAVGTPVVASDTEGIRDLITNDKNGLLVPPKDIGQLKMALKEIADRPDLRERLTAEGLRRSTFFTVERMAGEHMALYERLLRERR
jgi:glycosyltransferase involved in cell wall biosynthesis